jgi:acyl-CoA synthetase (NDP forming)
MKLYEHEAADIFSGFGIRVPERILATTPDEAVMAAEKIGLPLVVKAQVLAGGRGLAGGVQTVATVEETQAVAGQLLNSRIQGIKVRSIMVVRKVDYYRELYLGITGRIGSVQTHWMLGYGTNIVAGVTPGKGGTSVEGVPVFDSVLEAVEKTGAEASVFFVPAPFVLDAFIETVDAGINLIVVVPEHIPVLDVMKMKAYLHRHEDRKLFALGPTTAGILTPGEAKMGIMPASL